jgi:hypothetical protein
VILVLPVVLGSFVCAGRGRQLPWLLDPPLRYLALRRALGSNGAGSPILDLGACRLLASRIQKRIFEIVNAHIWP